MPTATRNDKIYRYLKADATSVWFRYSVDSAGAYQFLFQTGTSGADQTLVSTQDAFTKPGSPAATLSTGNVIDPVIVNIGDFADGSAANPSITFLNEQTTGLYRAGAGLLGVTILGTQVGQFAAGQVQMTSGSAGAPAYSFISSATDGLYLPSVNIIGLTLAGTEAARFSRVSSNFRITGQDSQYIEYNSGAIKLVGGGTNQSITFTPSGTGGVLISDGALATPGLAFTADTNTGFYRPGTDNLAVVTGGAIAGYFSGSQHLLLGGQTTDGAAGAVLQIPSSATGGLILYATSDVTTNTEYMQMLWSGGVAILQNGQSGSGTWRTLRLRNQSGTSSVSLNSSGDVSAIAFSVGGFSSPANFTAFPFTGPSQSQTSGTNAIVSISGTYNQGSGTAANTDLLVNRTQTAVGSGAQLLIDLQVSTVSKFSVDNSGQVIAAGIINAGNDIRLGTTYILHWQNSTTLKAPSDGVMTLLNNAQSDFTRLQFGGTTNAFPALKRNAAGIDFVNGDDSAFATIKALNLVVSSGTFLISSAAAFTNNAAAQVATITNGPTAGNPTKWIPINDNGTTRNIPAW